MKVEVYEDIEQERSSFIGLDGILGSSVCEKVTGTVAGSATPAGCAAFFECA